MCRAYESSCANLEFRGGCDLVPFIESVLAEIATTDMKEGSQWSPPALVSPTLAMLCDLLRSAAVEELTPEVLDYVKPIVEAVPIIELETPAEVGPTLAEGLLV